MDGETPLLKWSAQLEVGELATLPGDKILLPPSALEQLLAAAPTVVTESSAPRSHGSSFDPFNPYAVAQERAARAAFQTRHQQLPHPLTFRLVNPVSGHVVFAGIREFSAEEGQIGLSPFLFKALGLDSNKESTEGAINSAKDDQTKQAKHTLTIHAKELPRGTYVKLRPLEPGYDPEDWKSLLEEHMRKNFTTLTKGELLTIPIGRAIKGQQEEFRFLVDEFKPEGEGICVVDTDLEVDIEALNEEQARETLRRISAKRQRTPGTAEGSSPGGSLDLFQEQIGQVLQTEYVDYELPSWIRSQGLQLELTATSSDDHLYLLASPWSSRHRTKPREDEYVFGNLDNRPSKRLRISSTNVEMEDAESLWVSVHAPASIQSTSPAGLKQFQLRASSYELSDVGKEQNEEVEVQPGPGETRCKNCKQIVPQQSLILHENFCLRNNILCPKGCNHVYQKRSSEWQNHWHCDHDTAYGDLAEGYDEHIRVFHTTQPCSNCNLTFPSLPLLAHHRTTTCPGKLILCSFCHLVVPQEGDPDGQPDPEALLSGLTPHELADGARTTECHLCDRRVRLRDMATHLKNHDLERFNRETPRICRNIYCGRTLDGTTETGDTRSSTRMGQGPGNEIGLCSTCFGPLYISLHDPEGKALRRRVERRYLSQLLTGCGKPWCQNAFCKTGRQHINTQQQQTEPVASMTTKDALPLVKPFIDGLMAGETPLHFCVDETSQGRRNVAEMLSQQPAMTMDGKTYGFAWCIGALEAAQGDASKAKDWLKNFAVTKGDER